MKRLDAEWSETETAICNLELCHHSSFHSEPANSKSPSRFHPLSLPYSSHISHTRSYSKDFKQQWMTRAAGNVVSWARLAGRNVSRELSPCANTQYVRKTKVFLDEAWFNMTANRCKCMNMKHYTRHVGIKNSRVNFLLRKSRLLITFNCDQMLKLSLFWSLLFKKVGQYVEWKRTFHFHVSFPFTWSVSI